MEIATNCCLLVFKNIVFFAHPFCLNKNEILRSGYHRKSYRRKDGTYVKATYVKPVCIKDKGSKGKGPKTLPPVTDKDLLGQFGYALSESFEIVNGILDE